MSSLSSLQFFLETLPFTSFYYVCKRYILCVTGDVLFIPNRLIRIVQILIKSNNQQVLSSSPPFCCATISETTWLIEALCTIKKIESSGDILAYAVMKQCQQLHQERLWAKLEKRDCSNVECFNISYFACEMAPIICTIP